MLYIVLIQRILHKTLMYFVKKGEKNKAKLRTNQKRASGCPREKRRATNPANNIDVFIIFYVFYIVLCFFLHFLHCFTLFKLFLTFCTCFNNVFHMFYLLKFVFEYTKSQQEKQIK